LNSTCSDSGCNNYTAGASTAELNWLKNDLAINPGVCTLAYWHHPLFSSGVFTDSAGQTQSIASPSVKPMWDALYSAHADLVLNGHAHSYERFARQDPSKNVVAGGIREIVAGTGGEDHHSAVKQPNSQSLDTTDFGALFLTLHPSGYDWRFKSVGGTLVDQGSDTCNRHTTSTAVRSTPNPSTPSKSVTLTATVTDTSASPAVPTGTVNFKFGSASVGSTPLDSTGHASITVPAQAVGTYQYGASYVGSQTTLASTSSTGTQQVTPDPPSGVTASPGNGSVTLNWTAPPGATGYKVLRGTSPGMESSVPVGTTTRATSYTDTGLTNGTTYYYKVIATSAAGDGAPSSEVNATPQPPAPAAPAGVSAKAGDGNVTVSWTASPGATSYKVLRGTATHGESSTPLPAQSGTSYTDTGLTNGTTYYYEVIATNGGGDSPRSVEASATPQAPPPPPASPAPSPAPAPNPTPGPAAAPPDTTPPTTALSTPADGAHYVLGASVDAAYGCQDEQNGSGMASCTGTVVRGHAIDTGSLGTKAFTVTATDDAHNQASKTVHYTVDADPGPAEIKASVGAALQAAAHALSRLHLRALVRVSSFRFSFNASAPGTAVFTATVRIKGKTVTVASGQFAFSGPGKRTATQKISRAAARALRGLRSAVVFERIKFTPARGNLFVGRKRVTLRR